jgi:hypothetical protein
VRLRDVVRLSSEARSWTVAIAVAVALSFVASGLARGCRDRRPPEPPPTVPGSIDPGVPVAGPATERPPVLEPCLPVARPDLSRAEVLKLAVRYGVRVDDGSNRPAGGHQAAPGRANGSGATDQPSVVVGPSEVNLVTFPLFLGEEGFAHAASGVSATVSAWQVDPGGRIDLRAAWNPWTPPAPAPADDRLLGNVGRWQTGFLVGLAGVRTSEGDAGGGLGAGFHLRFRGWRVARVTGDVGGLALATETGDVAGVVGLGLSW